MGSELRGLFLYNAKVVVTKLDNNMLKISYINGIGNDKISTHYLDVGDTATIYVEDIMGSAVTHDTSNDIELTLSKLRDRYKSMRDILS